MVVVKGWWCRGGSRDVGRVGGIGVDECQGPGIGLAFTIFAFERRTNQRTNEAIFIQALS